MQSFTQQIAPPLISVVMPVRNGQRFVQAAVESVLAQTFTDFEFLIVDDGSTDETLKIVKRLADGDSRITVFEREGSGIVDAMNFACARAQGEFIARMDSDDLAHPDRFKRQTSYLKKHPNVVLLGGQVSIIDAQGQKIRHGQYPIGAKNCLDHLQVGSPINHPASIFRKSAFVSVGGYRKKFEYAEDYDLWLRMSKIGEIDNLAVRVLQYRIHGDNITVAKASACSTSTALALVEAQLGEQATQNISIQDKEKDWWQIRKKLLLEPSILGDVAYLRSMVLTGAPLDADQCIKLVSAVRYAKTSAMNLISERAASFTVVRAIIALAKTRKIKSLAKVIFNSFRSNPTSMTTEVLRIAKNWIYRWVRKR